MLSNRYKSTEVDCRTWLHVPWFIVNTKDQESVYLQFYTTLTLPTIVYLQQL